MNGTIKYENTEIYDDPSNMQMVSIDKIKNQSGNAQTQPQLEHESDESDDDVQFVKAERIVKPAPSENRLRLGPEKPVSVHEPEDDPLAVNKFFPCTQCKKILSSGEDLVKHMQLRHMKKQRKSKAKHPGGDGPRSCGLCGMNFEKRNSWAAHMNAHKNEDAKVQVECRICGEKFNSNGTLWNHRKNVHVPDLLKCDLCNKTFVTKSAFDKHMEKHAHDAPIICEICGRSFPMKKALETHMYGHTGEKPFLCAECGASFTSNQCLREHLKRHIGVKKHGCTICGKRFFEKSKLKKHNYIHTKEKPHVCEICGRSFVFPFFLRQHHRTHTGEKPYPCNFDEICQRRFTSMAQLKRHVMGYHKGEKPFKCDSCDRCFIDRQKLEGHIKRVHQKSVILPPPISYSAYDETNEMECKAPPLPHTMEAINYHKTLQPPDLM